jgi:ribosomal protein L11 methyltransferase
MTSQSYFYFDLYLLAQNVDTVSEKAWAILPGVQGVEETNELGQGFQTIAPEFDILEFGSEAAQKSSEYFETLNSSPNKKIYMRVYVDGSDASNLKECARVLEEWKKSDFILDFAQYSKDSVDYFEEFKKTFKGRFLNDEIWIGPPWDNPPQKPKYSIVVEPGMAFGTGDHPTTQMCVERLWELQKTGFKPKNILDLGTGTGVLAVACRLFFPESKIVALDLDPQCEENFLKNCALNGIEASTFDYRFGEFQGDVKNLNEKFDLIVSNIYAEVLAFLYPHIDRLLKSQSLWVTSGILKGRSENALLEKCRFNLEQRNTRSKDGDDWVMLSFLKP